MPSSASSSPTSIRLRTAVTQWVVSGASAPSEAVGARHGQPRRGQASFLFFLLGQLWGMWHEDEMGDKDILPHKMVLFGHGVLPKMTIEHGAIEDRKKEQKSA